jgi:hypothetical protein
VFLQLHCTLDQVENLFNIDQAMVCLGAKIHQVIKDLGIVILVPVPMGMVFQVVYHRAMIHPIQFRNLNGIASKEPAQGVDYTSPASNYVTLPGSGVCYVYPI